jgi:hypothetical protein
MDPQGQTCSPNCTQEAGDFSETIAGARLLTTDIWLGECDSCTNGKEIRYPPSVGSFVISLRSRSFLPSCTLLRANSIGRSF